MTEARASGGVRLLAIGLVALLSFGLALPLDFDGDGLLLVEEWHHGTAALDADSDGDGLLDGAEVAGGTGPTQRDTDKDGLHDGEEARLPSQALQADSDGDGVLDGDEGAVECLLRIDCDGDGIPDGGEAPTFDPLDADTFDVGLSDAVVAAFDAAGQPAGPDADADGIPDRWEETPGLISWGPFQPQPGQPNLLVEYLRVDGPSSGRFDLDFTPAYQAVAQMFAEQGIALQWIETRASTTTEVRPGFLAGEDLPYYRAALERGVASDNPFVTTVVLNPQQVQEDLSGEVLGAAFLRSMIATVDYGAHVEVVFEEADSDGIFLSGGTLAVSPSLESHILGAPRSQVRQIRFASEGIVDLGTTADGVFMVTRQSGTDFRWDWQNDWFVTAPNITQDGAYLQLRAVEARLDAATLAQTIAHELGHTLGLCHAHERECYEAFDPDDVSQATIDATTMSYTAPPGTLHFLPSEWRQVATYLVCPPQDPVRLVAAGASSEDVREAKYEQSFIQAASLRTCGAAYEVAADLPVDDGVDRTGNGAGTGWLILYLGAAGLAAVVAAVRT